MAAKKKRVGRRYSAESCDMEVARKICHDIAADTTVEKACRKRGRPTARTFYRWLADPENVELRQHYARARESQAEIMVDTVRDLLDRKPKTGVDVQWIRVQLDTYKWILCKVLPKVYGDRRVLEMPDLAALRGVNPQFLPMEHLDRIIHGEDPQIVVSAFFHAANVAGDRDRALPPALPGGNGASTPGNGSGD